MFISCSDVVLEDRPWPRGSSRTKNHVLGLGLGLGLESSGLGLGLGLEGRGLGLGLGLEGPGLDYKHVNFILWDVSLIHSVCELKCVCLHSMFKPH